MTIFQAVADAERCFVHLSTTHNALFALGTNGTLRAFNLTGGQRLGNGSYQQNRDGALFIFPPMRIALLRGQNTTRIRTPQGDRTGLLFEVMRNDDNVALQRLLAAPDTTAIHVGLDGVSRALRFDVAGALASYPPADPFTVGDPGAWSVVDDCELRTTTTAALATFTGPHLFTRLTGHGSFQRPGYLFLTALPNWPILGVRLLAARQMDQPQPGVCCFENFHFFYDPDEHEEMWIQTVVQARRIDYSGRPAEACLGLVRQFPSPPKRRRWLSLRRELRRYAGTDASITEFTFPPHSPVPAWNSAHVTMFRQSTGTFSAAVADGFTLNDLLAAGVQLLGSLATLHHLGFVHGGLDSEAIVQLPSPRHPSFGFKTLRDAAKLRPRGLAELPGYDPRFTPPEVAEQIERGARPAEVLISPAADAWALGSLLLTHTNRIRRAAHSEQARDLGAELTDVFSQLTARDPKGRMSCAEAASTLALFS